MRTWFLSAVALGVVLVVAGSAPAQRGGGAFMGSPVMLLRNQSVQEELKVTDEQKEKLQKFAEEFREKHGDDFQKLMDQNTDRQERAQLLAKLNKEGMKSAGEILKPEQVKRLRQISLQVQGAQAFAEPEVQKKLNL